MTYTYALRHLPVTFVASYAYVNPIIAVALGVVLLGEPFTSRMMLAAALVLAGVTVLRRVRPVATTPTANPRGEETPSARRIAWRAAENYRRGRPFTRLPFRMRNSVSCGVAIVRRFGR